VNGKFTVLSIDDKQGKWLNENLERIALWCSNRINVYDYKPTKEFRIFCVPDKSTLKRLFDVSSTTCEYRNDVCVLWVSFDESPQINLYPHLTDLIISDYAAKEGLNFDFWLHKGLCEFNADTGYLLNSFVGIKSLIDSKKSIFGLSYILNMDEYKYNNEKEDRKRLFCNQSAILIYMLRKEFGEDKFRYFCNLKSNKSKSFDSCLKEVYGFNSISDFESNYLRYMLDLTSNAKANKIPTTYFEVN
jgi:hypothetical protein